MPSAEPVNTSAEVVLLFPLNVGTPAGQEMVGCVNDPAAMVGTPAGHAIVPAGVPALVAALTPLKVAADTPLALAVNNFMVLPEVASAKVPGPCVCVFINVPANVGTPAGQEIAPSENAPLAFVGTPAGQAMVPVGVTVPVEFVPAGVPADLPLRRRRPRRAPPTRDPRRA